MKKQKLTLEKFTVLKLKNPSKILGGNDGTDGGETGKGNKCYLGSAVFVKEKDQE